MVVMCLLDRAPREERGSQQSVQVLDLPVCAILCPGGLSSSVVVWDQPMLRASYDFESLYSIHLSDTVRRGRERVGLEQIGGPQLESASIFPGC